MGHRNYNRDLSQQAQMTFTSSAWPGWSPPSKGCVNSWCDHTQVVLVLAMNKRVLAVLVKANPADCKSAPKLRCLLDNPSGLAAGAHDVLWCFVAALQMGRTLILNSTPWHYTPNDRGWTEVLQPVAGPSCENAGSQNMVVDGYPGHEWGLKTRSRMRDLPASFAKDLVANHGEPYAWWYGQILAYIFRLQNSTRKLIEDFKMKNDYKHPIVAIHIRRTDKKEEAAFHDVTEYMQHAEEFYSSLALRGQQVQKRVFIATDDPEVITEIIQK
ncbi:hypothetical protein HPB51_026517 [Rhipicephalus microplus]|uniref:GT23 domain-containing protein n=1 Tax=Rhipicephalus microplus TaxID=6941 RepID=A0A9J6D2V4_RHIMP|nr:hypothetical protein HPB51_026517 [Rhipicephalus microplus]